MADGFRIDFDGEEAAHIRAAAEARGMPVEDFVRGMLRLALNSQDSLLGLDLDVAEDEAAFEDFERTGMAIPHDEVAAWLRSLTTGNPLPMPTARKVR